MIRPIPFPVLCRWTNLTISLSRVPSYQRMTPVKHKKPQWHVPHNMLGSQRSKAKICKTSSKVYAIRCSTLRPSILVIKINWLPLAIDEGKVAEAFFDSWRQHRLEIKVARIFNTSAA